MHVQPAYHGQSLPHEPGWIHGYKHGKQANEKLHAVVNPVPYKGANLLEENSFFSLDREGVIISTIKKAEDDQGVIIRMYNLTEEEQKVSLKHGFHFQKAIGTNLIEEEAQEIPLVNYQVELPLKHHAIETIKLK